MAYSDRSFAPLCLCLSAKGGGVMLSCLTGEGISVEFSDVAS